MSFSFSSLFPLTLFGVSGIASAEPLHHFEFNWQDKYITQGRNNLPEGDLFSLTYQYALSDSFSAGFLYATSPRFFYNELHFGLNYHLDLFTGELDVSYERLIFDRQTPDNELAFEWHYDAVLTPALHGVYSTESGGAFVTLSLSHEFQFDALNLSLATYLAEGFDFSYISALDQGENHFQMGVEAFYPLSRSVTLRAALEQGVVHSRLRALGEQDERWFGVGLQSDF